ncbi:hypothetical protein C0993_002993 [Termitomyces sp. T159_Od127]|nr:hypothetical protein C0993_002993 [Termitomyces sp. T159_Od127]
MDQISPILDLLVYRPVVPLALLALAYLVYSIVPATRSSIQNLPCPVKFFWGHEKTVFVNQPGMAFRKWIGNLGLIFRIKAALGVGQAF